MRHQDNGGRNAHGCEINIVFFLIAGLVLPELARAQERPTVIRAATLLDAIARGTIPGPRLLTSLRPVDETTGTPQQIRAFVRQVVAEWISGSKE